MDYVMGLNERSQHPRTVKGDGYNAGDTPPCPSSIMKRIIFIVFVFEAPNEGPFYVCQAASFMPLRFILCEYASTPSQSPSQSASMRKSFTHLAQRRTFNAFGKRSLYFKNFLLKSIIKMTGLSALFALYFPLFALCLACSIFNLFRYNQSSTPPAYAVFIVV